MVVVMAVCVMIGLCLGRSTTDDKQPVVIETVTVASPSPSASVVTVSVMPESCQRALDAMLKIINEADTVASHDGEQLDIMELAYQAIYKKDWKSLNDLSDRQRKLWFGLTEETSTVLPEMADIQRDVAECKAKVES